jgi:hypothetical protein
VAAAGLACAAAAILGGSSPAVASTRSGAPIGARTARVKIGTITLSPQAVTLPNPAGLGQSGTPERRIRVSLRVLDSRGKAIKRGTFAQPIKLRVYGPSAGVLTASTPVIRSATSAVYFSYSGGYVANSIIVTAVSGHAFAVMAFQPKNRGFPGTSSATFPMPNTNDRNIKSGWRFTVSVGGGRQRGMEMDTGSRGVVVPAAALGRQAVGPGPRGKLEYSSDGKIFSGHFYLTPLKLILPGGSVTTVPIEVLGVNKSSCDSKYPKCVRGKVSGLSMMGVGFARGGLIPNTPPELTNAFLALTGIIQGSMHPGYIVTANGVTLGITAADQAGYSEIPLTPGGTGPGDWNTEPGCFAFPAIAGYGPQCGTVLVDTGIASAILGLSQSQRPRSIAGSIPNGVQIQIALPNTANPAFSYAFTTGDGGAMTPTSIRWANGSAPFVNTGRRPISQYNYLFDDGSGAVGFKPATP